MIEVIKPCKEYLESYYEACAETKGHLHDNYIMHNPDTYDEWKNSIFEEYERKEQGVDLPKGFLPSATRWIVEDEKYIGTINVRKKVNDVLMDWGGSVGYAIRYGARGNGYATKALEKCKNLKELYEYVEDEFVVFTIEKSNIPSLKVFHGLHYNDVKEDFYITKVNNEDEEVYRFVVNKKEVFDA